MQETSTSSCRTSPGRRSWAYRGYQHPRKRPRPGLSHGTSDARQSNSEVKSVVFQGITYVGIRDLEDPTPPPPVEGEGIQPDDWKWYDLSTLQNYLLPC